MTLTCWWYSAPWPQLEMAGTKREQSQSPNEQQRGSSTFCSPVALRLFRHFCFGLYLLFFFLVFFWSRHPEKTQVQVFSTTWMLSHSVRLIEDRWLAPYQRWASDLDQKQHFFYTRALSDFVRSILRLTYSHEMQLQLRSRSFRPRGHSLFHLYDL